ncbi:MSMEG_1061 family FMN-dependent PPOX-type flavoprotein [Arsenicicoccus sp. oral taxon 190]|uniref:MSMEG_1061 family FMN-dependent PPOX-type flavoprotein n=1 Tax=Arsenicicoccus sp. oral taxon 190 TaxID=1658671 RepID=UPI00067A41B4|nr:MSMEG_1061 family FMN-dependent PPOX-type flavoprotein [Arsenicicoccus sp. oral taxon 190]AKT52139.1 pyridoxamine 5'-phosphate oxidase [Arsenicicoccus sp. oral taxon 190]
MSGARGQVQTVTTAARLREIVGEPGERARTKVRPVLDGDDRAWLAAATLCFLATSDAAGRCDVSPKGDPPGRLVHVVDDTTLAIGERPGNRRVDGYLNVLDNPRVGMVFVVPGRSDVLRVNGVATLVEDAPWFADLTVQGRRPVLALMVHVEEVFGHCAKALVRSQAWHPKTWDPAGVTDVSASARQRRARGLPDLHAAITDVGQLEQAQVDSYDVPLY